MKNAILVLSVFFLASLFLYGEEAKSIFEFKVKDIEGKEVDLASYKGKTLLIVNVASKCGNTKQYKDLVALSDKYKDKNFVVLGFPANEFGDALKATAQLAKAGIAPPVVHIGLTAANDDQHHAFDTHWDQQ